jgi:hypothetical protein
LFFSSEKFDEKKKVLPLLPCELMSFVMHSIFLVPQTVPII